MGKVKTYNSKLVTCSFGTHIVTGFADDSFITIEEKGDGVTSKTGCDGEIARAIDPNEQYTVKISLLQTSDSGKYLQSRYDIDKKTGEGTFPILIKDLRGGLVFSADCAWVQKQASRTYGKDTNNREWSIETGSATLKDN